MLKTGDLLLVQGTSWLSKTIRFFTRSEVSHVGIFVELNGKLFVSESDSYKGGSGVILTDYDDYLKSNKKLFAKRPYFTINKEEFTNFIVENTGKFKYDKKTLLIQVWHQVTGGWIGNKDVADDHRVICSQWCAYVYQNFNKNLLNNWYSMSPEDFAQSHLFYKI